MQIERRSVRGFKRKLKILTQCQLKNNACFIRGRFLDEQNFLMAEKWPEILNDS